MRGTVGLYNVERASIGVSYSPVGTSGFFNINISVGLGYGGFLGARYQNIPVYAPLINW